jgi:hypothetical protein
VPTDTTPARVGIVADSRLKDQRIPFPDPARPQPSSRTCSALSWQQGVAAHSSRHQVQMFDTRRPAVEGRPWASAHKLPPGLPLDHLGPVLALPVRRLPLLSEGNC